MKTGAHGFRWFVYCEVLLVCFVVVARGAEPGATAFENREISGRVVCVAEEMHRLYGADLPTRHPHLYGFRADDGTLYTLLRTKMSEALFVDPRLHSKHLRFNARVFPGTQVLEVIGAFRSLKQGKVYDLYYYCDICAIQAVSPEPCQCCQKEVELVEELLGESTKRKSQPASR